MYAKVVDGVVVQYPYTNANLRADHPNTSFPDPLGDATRQAFGMLPVAAVAPPADDGTHTAEELPPAFVNGTLTQRWQENVPPLGEIKARLRARLRARRKRAESAGVALGQRRVPTDRDFRLQLRELKDWAGANPGQQIPVEVDGGDVVRINAGQLAAAITAVSNHMRACLDVEADKIDEIAALATAAQARQWIASSLDAGWPD